MELLIDSLLTGIAFVILYLVLNYLDRWSTSTLLAYNEKTTNDVEYRNKMIEYRKSRGKLMMELNPFARSFMKKFGVEKGMKIFTFVWGVPYLIALFASITLGIVDFTFAAVLISFYLGALYVQILRARRSKQDMARLEAFEKGGIV